MRFIYLILLISAPVFASSAIYYFDAPTTGNSIDLASALEKASSNDVFILNTSAQQVVVVDESDSQPIPGVAVFNDLKTITAITNFDGDVNLAVFGPLDKIHFQHLSYLKKSIPKTTIQDTIYLSPKATSLNEIVISASKFEQSKKEVPQNIIKAIQPSITIILINRYINVISHKYRKVINKSND